MAEWSQSHFLQSLGWATLNSLWQMALLWALYLAASSLFTLSSSRKYQFSVLAVLAGFAWFLGSFLYYYGSDTTTSIAFFDQKINHSNNLLQVFLTSASIAYLLLLAIPAFRLVRNWQFVNRIKKEGLKKADLTYRLFVQKIAAQIGIRKKVQVFVSSLVRSPLTVGYLKPIVLLPVAALNHLTIQQVEAVLLHELSHIRRYDYLVNLVIMMIHTILYFNPFIKFFLKNIEAERENCCDELVLQYGYDKVGYASALLTLEQVSSQPQVLTLAATGKKYLLSRIEKIIGMEKKNKRNRLNHMAGLFAALLCVLVFNSVLIIREEKAAVNLVARDSFSNPFTIFQPAFNREPVHSVTPLPFKSEENSVATHSHPRSGEMTMDDVIEMVNGDYYMAPVSTEASQFMQVAVDDVEASLTLEQKEQVKSAVKATKKVLSSQWNKVEESMADALTEQEKELAKVQYLQQLEAINWHNVENNLKAGFQSIDWNKLNGTLDQALTEIKIDSMQKRYNLVLKELSKVQCESNQAKLAESVIPDASLEEVARKKDEVRKQLELLKARPKKVVRL